MSDSYDLCDDVLLIAQFCGGDKKAWDVLYGGHQPRLLLSVKGLLHKHGLHGQPPEDIAQEIWLMLLSNDQNRLKRYDPTRGSFHRYLEMLADRLIQQLGRSKTRRTVPEVPLKRRDPADPGSEDSLVRAELAEFFNGLTPQERRYMEEKLLRKPKPATEPPISASNERQLKHRMRQKW